MSSGKAFLPLKFCICPQFKEMHKGAHMAGNFSMQMSELQKFRVFLEGTRDNGGKLTRFSLAHRDIFIYSTGIWNF